MRTATREDFEVGATLVDQDGNEFTITSHYSTDSWEARGKRGEKVLDAGEAEFYQIDAPAPLDDYTAVALAEGFQEAESHEQLVEAWQYLHNTGLAYQLQGWFGRTAQSLIEQEVIAA